MPNVVTRHPFTRDLAAVTGLVALAVVAAAFWTSPPQWKPDSLFYQAHAYQVEGDSHTIAYRKAFAGPLALERREFELALPVARHRVTNPAWVRYSERFYERRWFVPAAAALLSPVYATDSLRVTSLVFYVLLGAALYVLLRLRANRAVSVLVSGGALLLAPVLVVAGQPLMDVCGATLETIAAAGAMLALERGLGWLALWVAALVALSLTRDSSVILVLAAVWLALRERSRKTLLLAVAGVAAATPVPLALGAPVREAMAYTFSGFDRPRDASWGWIASQYWPNIRSLVRHNLIYLQTHPFTALYLVGGYLALFVVRSHGDRFVRFFRAAAVGSIALDAFQPNYTAFRLELMFVPIAAAGLAVGLTALRDVAVATRLSRAEGTGRT